MKMIKSLLIFFVFSISINLSAQNYAWHLLDTTNGLGSNNVKTIFVENDSSIWLGTDKGLSYFNGKTVTNYSLSNMNIAGSLSVLQILKTQNIIWFRTDSGVGSYDGSSFANYNQKNGLLSNRVNSITSTSNGDLWIGSDSGVSVYNGSKFTSQDSILNEYIIADGNDNIYAFKRLRLTPYDKTIQIFDGNKWKRYNALIHENLNVISTVNKNTSGTIIVGVNDRDWYFEISPTGKIKRNALAKKSISPYPGPGYSNIAMDKNDTWALTRVLASFQRGKDSILYEVPLYAPFSNILSRDLLFTDIGLGNKKVFVSTNMGLLYTYKAINSRRPSVVFAPNNLSTEVMGGFSPFTTNNAMQDLEFPKDSGTNGIKYSHFVVAAKSNTQNNWEVSPSTSTSSLNYGPVNSSLGLGNYYIAKVSRLEIQKHKNSYKSTSYSMPDGIKYWPAVGDSTYNMGADLAPFIDVNNNGCYDPENGDYPAIKGDEAIYWINHPPQDTLPFEYHYMLYAFNDSTDKYINQTMFLDYKIINRSNIKYDSVKIGFYVDGDIGTPYDDYFGCDSLKNTFYFYNSDNFDEPSPFGGNYANNPPALGVKSLSDSLMSFMVSQNPSAGPNGYPYQKQDWLNAFNSKWKNGQKVMYGGNGYQSSGTSNSPTKYMYPGDPVLQKGWTEKNNGGKANPNSDRSGFASFPTITLKGGESKTISLAFGFGQKASVNKATDNISEMFNVLAHAKVVWDTSSSPLVSYGQNYNCKIRVKSSSAVTSLTEIENDENNSQLKVYPVPSQSFLNIESEKVLHCVQLFNMEGKLLFKKEIKQRQTSLNLSKFPEGIYFLRIQMEDNSSSNRKIILTK